MDSRNSLHLPTLRAGFLAFSPLATNAWQPMLGNQCLATNAWQPMIGNQCLATNAWQPMLGNHLHFRVFSHQAVLGLDLFCDHLKISHFTTYKAYRWALSRDQGRINLTPRFQPASPRAASAWVVLLLQDLFHLDHLGHKTSDNPLLVNTQAVAEGWFF